MPPPMSGQNVGKRAMRWGAGAPGLLLAAASWATHAADLTPTEQRWLVAAVPVLQYAKDLALPLDIVVRPQAEAGDTPLGMAFVAGRCKLVLAMRGNPEAQATLDRVEPRLVGAVVEAVVAHELAHCWRHLQKDWGQLPEGLGDEAWRSRVSQEQAALLSDMWQTRREEAYADLVGLAWTLQHHPELYEAVHAWHVRLRAKQAVDTGPHDTRLWVQLAHDRQAFAPAGLIFDQVRPLWVAGLRSGAGAF
jgi:hypothetical protein